MVKSKAKGRRFEYWLRDNLKDVFPRIERAVLSGAISHEGDLWNTEDYLFEAKHQENWRVKEWLHQLESQCDHFFPRRKGVLVFKRNNEKPLALVEFDLLHHLLMCEKELKEICDEH